MEAGGSTVSSQQGIEKQEEIGVFDVQRQGRGGDKQGVSANHRGIFTSQNNTVIIYRLYLIPEAILWNHVNQ